MAKLVFVVLVLALQGCAGFPAMPASTSACALNQASYACQVENYHRAP